MDIIPYYEPGDYDMEGDHGLPADDRAEYKANQRYAGDTGELLDTIEKEHAHYERQIAELSEFLMKNYDDKICGSAIETAIAIITEQSEQLGNISRGLDLNWLDDDD